MTKPTGTVKVTVVAGTTIVKVKAACGCKRATYRSASIMTSNFHRCGTHVPDGAVDAVAAAAAAELAASDGGGEL